MGHGGPVLGLHKASFVVWAGAFGLHVLWYGVRALRFALADRRDPLAGAGLRIAVVLAAVAVGVAVALATLPLAHGWQPWAH
jgi:multisubunit Na+/H+ antiporter MnhB subunit